MSDNIPFHESGGQFNREGASDNCLYNDHNLCRSTRCGCSCHRETRMAAATDTNRNHHLSSQNNAVGSIQTGLDKYCPKCKVKAPSEQFYCKVDGTQLSSLRCPECQTPGEEVDNYCGHCGSLMKLTDIQLEAAATGPVVNGISEDLVESPVTTADNMDAEEAMRVAIGETKKAKVNKRMFK